VVTIWVTDNFELPPGDPSGNPRLAERVKVFEITRDGRALESAHVASFGEVEGEGALWKVETIAVDPVNDVLLVVDETESRMGMRIYTPAGEFTGRIVGGDVFSAEPEGIGLWTDGDAGYWVATDQHAALSVYHLFDRTTFAHVGAFAGAVTANTDGIAVVGRPVGPFPDGAVFAVHDDQGVSAFDWRTVGAAMD
jgi:3-phytase